MSYRVQINSRIGDVAKAWGELDCPSFYLSYPWLSSVEGMLSPHNFYLTLWSTQKSLPLAGIPCYLIDDEATYHFYNVPKLLFSERTVEEARLFLTKEEGRRLNEIVTSLRAYGNRFYPILICVAPYGYISSICYRPGLTSAEFMESAHRLVEAVDALASELGARSKAFMYVPQRGDPYLHAALVERGYLSTLLLGECLLPIKWNSFDEYLNVLSKGRREAIRKEMRKFQECGLTVYSENSSALTDELAVLQANVQRKYGHRADTERIKLGYRRIKEFLSPFVRLFIARKGEQPVGFALFYEFENTYYAKVVGFDYDQLGDKRCYAYFNTLFYAPIEEAIARRVRAIHYGSESYEAKLGRGAQLQNLLGYFHFGGEISKEVEECLMLEEKALRNRFSHLRSY